VQETRQAHRRSRHDHDCATTECDGMIGYEQEDAELGETFTQNSDAPDRYLPQPIPRDYAMDPRD